MASPRENFKQQFQDKALAAVVWDALQLASTHDPDHAREIKALNGELNNLNNVVVKADLTRVDQDARRALRWCERLFGRVDKLEKKKASDDFVIQVNNDLIDRLEKQVAELRKEMKEMHKSLSNDIIYNHNHAVDVIDKRMKEFK